MSFQNKKFAVDGVSWTAIISPIVANHVSIQVPSSFTIKIRTDSADINTEKAYPASSEPYITAPMYNTDWETRFPIGATVCFVQCGGAGDTGSVYCTFMK